MSSIPHIYFDTASFIDVVRLEADEALDSKRRKDCWYLQQLLQASRDKQIRVFTSIVTVAECRPSKNETNTRARGLFDRLLTSGDYVVLMQPTLKIARIARDLEFDHGIRTRALDSIHIATALDRNCIELFTTDTDMSKRGVKNALEKLGLRVRSGADTKVLPDAYRQEEMEGLGTASKKGKT